MRAELAWYMDDEFRTPMPRGLSLEVRRFYGGGEVGKDFAQSLAAFLACDQPRDALARALADDPRTLRQVGVLYAGSFLSMEEARRAPPLAAIGPIEHVFVIEDPQVER